MARKKTHSTTISHKDPVTYFASQVTSGEIVAGPDIRSACKRHLKDIKEGPRRGLKWDLPAAMRAINFFKDVLRLNGGEFEGAPFELLLWQAFIVGSIFGWKEQDGFRRFRMVYTESGKGSGKSPLAAGIGIYMQVADDEPRAEIYAAATKKDQAMILFRDAVAMVMQSPALMERLDFSGGPGREWNIAYLSTGSFFRSISSDDGQSGPRPHCALIDEIHEHKTNEVVEMMRAGTKGRRQALIFMITNSGFDRTSVCYDYHEYGQKVAAGDLEDDSFFSFICSLDEGDDPLKDRSCWPKANPSLGHTFQPKYLEEQVTAAKGMPSKESIVRRLNFCEWVDAASPWIDGDLWRACEVDDLDPIAFLGKKVFLALDLSGTTDLTAMAIVVPDDQGGFDAWVEFWTPADTLLERARRDRVPYDAWERKGHIGAPPGRAIDYAYVAKRIGQISGDYEIVGCAFDPYRIKYLEQDLADQGIDINLVSHGQGFARSSTSGLWMPRSIQLLESAVLESGLRVKKNPCLTWNSASAVLISDAQENRKFDKRRATGRIDGLVALAMAVGAADGQMDITSIYESREMMIF